MMGIECLLVRTLSSYIVLYYLALKGRVYFALKVVFFSEILIKLYREINT